MNEQTKKKRPKKFKIEWAHKSQSGMWNGNYEYVEENGSQVRKFTLHRSFTRQTPTGITSRTLYFTSWQEAVKKGWKPVRHK